jgi:hypothetical protein
MYIVKLLIGSLIGWVYMMKNETPESIADQPRQGWDEAFKAMADQGDEALLDEGELQPSLWDETEWEW